MYDHKYWFILILWLGLGCTSPEKKEVKVPDRVAPRIAFDRTVRGTYRVPPPKVGQQIYIYQGYKLAIMGAGGNLVEAEVGPKNAYAVPQGARGMVIADPDRGHHIILFDPTLKKPAPEKFRQFDLYYGQPQSGITDKVRVKIPLVQSFQVRENKVAADETLPVYFSHFDAANHIQLELSLHYPPDSEEMKLFDMSSLVRRAVRHKYPPAFSYRRLFEYVSRDDNGTVVHYIPKKLPTPEKFGRSLAKARPHVAVRASGQRREHQFSFRTPVLLGVGTANQSVAQMDNPEDLYLYSRGMKLGDNVVVYKMDLGQSQLDDTSLPFYHKVGELYGEESQPFLPKYNLSAVVQGYQKLGTLRGGKGKGEIYGRVIPRDMGYQFDPKTEKEYWRTWEMSKKFAPEYETFQTNREDPTRRYPEYRKLPVYLPIAKVKEGKKSVLFAHRFGRWWQLKLNSLIRFRVKFKDSYQVHKFYDCRRENLTIPDSNSMEWLHRKLVRDYLKSRSSQGLVLGLALSLFDGVDRDRQEAIYLRILADQKLETILAEEIFTLPNTPRYTEVRQRFASFMTHFLGRERAQSFTNQWNKVVSSKGAHSMGPLVREWMATFQELTRRRPVATTRGEDMPHRFQRIYLSQNYHWKKLNQKDREKVARVVAQFRGDQTVQPVWILWRGASPRVKEFLRQKGISYVDWEKGEQYTARDQGLTYSPR